MDGSMQKKTKRYKYIILGAGPAGLQLGYFFQEDKKDYLIIEQGKAAGTTFLTQPVHKKLISINKVHTGFEKSDPVNLRWDWHSLLTKDHDERFTDLTTEYFPDRSYFVAYLNQFARDKQLNIQYESTIKNIKKDKNGFTLTDHKGKQFTCRYLIVATGVSKPYWADIPGIEHAAHYADLGLDKSEYENKRVLIIGKGNSGFETADYLIDSAALIHIASPNPLKYAWKTHYVGHVRAVNNNFLDTYQLKSQNAVINANITKILPKDGQYRVSYHYTLANDEKEDLMYDKVIAATGFKFDTDCFDKNCKPETAIMDRFPKMTSFYESTNIKDCYFAGTIMQHRDFKKKQSGFIHGFRYNVEFLYHYLNWKNDQKVLPHTKLSLTATTLAKEIIKQVNQTSALWQQTGYLCDLITLDPKKSEARYFSSIPVDFVKENFASNDLYTLIITLEFGQDRIDEYPDVFAIPRVHKDDYKNAHLSTGIHPIVTFCKGDKTISTHHLIEDFDSIWCEAVHVKPLTNYLKSLLETIKTVRKKRKKRCATP